MNRLLHQRSEKSDLFSFYEGGLPMSLFRVYVDGALFYHPQMSKLAITDARIEEDVENIDSIVSYYMPAF